MTWRPTHRSKNDGSELRLVEDEGYGDYSRVFLGENENGDRDEYLADEWEPICTCPRVFIGMKDSGCRRWRRWPAGRR